MIMLESDESVQRVLRSISRRIGLNDRERIYEAAALFAVRNRAAFEVFAGNIFSQTPIDRPALAVLSLTERKLLKDCGPGARVWQSRLAIRQGGKTAWLCPVGAARPRRVKIAMLERLVARGLLTLDEDGDIDLVWWRKA